MKYSRWSKDCHWDVSTGASDVHSGIVVVCKYTKDPTYCFRWEYDESLDSFLSTVASELSWDAAAELREILLRNLNDINNKNLEACCYDHFYVTTAQLRNSDKENPYADEEEEEEEDHECDDVDDDEEEEEESEDRIGESDPVNHPAHYCDMSKLVFNPFECIDVTKHMDFCFGNAFKYVFRAGLKDKCKTEEDLKKALWYLHMAYSTFGDRCDSSFLEAASVFGLVMVPGCDAFEKCRYDALQAIVDRDIDTAKTCITRMIDRKFTGPIDNEKYW